MELSGLGRSEQVSLIEFLKVGRDSMIRMDSGREFQKQGGTNSNSALSKLQSFSSSNWQRSVNKDGIYFLISADALIHVFNEDKRLSKSPRTSNMLPTRRHHLALSYITQML